MTYLHRRRHMLDLVKEHISLVLSSYVLACSTINSNISVTNNQLHLASGIFIIPNELSSESTFSSAQHCSQRKRCGLALAGLQN